MMNFTRQHRSYPVGAQFIGLGRASTCHWPIMNFNDQSRYCHPERSEASVLRPASDPSLRSEPALERVSRSPERSEGEGMTAVLQFAPMGGYLPPPCAWYNYISSKCI